MDWSMLSINPRSDVLFDAEPWDWSYWWLKPQKPWSARSILWLKPQKPWSAREHDKTINTVHTFCIITLLCGERAEQRLPPEVWEQVFEFIYPDRDF